MTENEFIQVLRHTANTHGLALTIPDWLAPMVRDISEKEAAEMLETAFRQLHLAAAIYHVVSFRPGPK